MNAKFYQIYQFIKFIKFYHIKCYKLQLVFIVLSFIKYIVYINHICSYLSQSMRHNKYIRIRIRIHLLTLLWDILRLPSSRRAALGLYVILILWRARDVKQPPYALLHRSSPCYALRHGRQHEAPSPLSSNFCAPNKLEKGYWMSDASEA